MLILYNLLKVMRKEYGFWMFIYRELQIYILVFVILGYKNKRECCCKLVEIKLGEFMENEEEKGIVFFRF